VEVKKSKEKWGDGEELMGFLRLEPCFGDLKEPQQSLDSSVFAFDPIFTRNS